MFSLLKKKKEPEKPVEEFPTEWRRMQWDKKDELEKKLRNFSIGNPDVQQVRILVVGPVGAGKSSFITSVNNVFQGRITSEALVDTASWKSFTKVYQSHYIEGKDGRPLAFLFNDSMGLEPEAGCGAQEDDIIKVLQGFIKEGYRVIIMTKPEEVCPLVKANLRMIYTSKKIKNKMQECSNRLGVPISHIFPVKNYHEEMSTDNDIDVLILKALDQIVNIANDLSKKKAPECSARCE